MISRYSRPEMQKIWSDQNKFQIWFEIEAHACDAMAEIGLIPSSSAKKIWEKGEFDISRINEIEKETKHDVIAFLTNLSEHIGEDARFLHKGMTSSDILDTALSIQMVQSTNLLIKDLKSLLKELKIISLDHKFSFCIGRSHGIHAEPTTFGLKMANHYAEFKRNLQRLENTKNEISICAISGAVGTFANIDPRVEEYVANKMNLNVEPISTQIIPRDRHALWFSNLALIASSIERISTEIRHLQRTEVREVEEYFYKGQKGSSAMPHKRNPVLSENLTGLSRVIRSSIIPAFENVTLWHERDISHSSVERILAPDTTILLDFSLNRLTNLVKQLVVYPKKMEENLNNLQGLIYSQQVLIKLIEAGFSREKAYSLVQTEANKVWNRNESFLELLMKNKEITKKISKKDLKSLFNINFHSKYVNYIFERVFK